MREWQNQSHVRWYCRYHIIIVPKYRQKAIFGTLRKDIGKILNDVERYSRFIKNRFSFTRTVSLISQDRDRRHDP
jgi:REP element-mobilizing transposase RayT